MIQLTYNVAIDKLNIRFESDEFNSLPICTPHNIHIEFDSNEISAKTIITATACRYKLPELGIKTLTAVFEFAHTLAFTN